jgi:hypothetical protein
VPVTGRKPKPEGQKRNRHKPTHDWTDVVDTPFAGAPKLPKSRPDGRPWPTGTRRKWAAWSTMPHCTLWGPAEWDFAFDALELHVRFLEGSVPAATELRNREKVLGTTADYRRDLRIRYVEQAEEPSDDEDAGVTQLADYRDAL